MEREIKFRGQKLINDQWVYGFYAGDHPFLNQSIIISGVTEYDVEPKTVGQYTGLKDKNDSEIYEDDIVIAKGEVNVLYLVKFGQFMYSDACFFLEEISDSNPPLRFFSRGIDQTEIIGNIYENPELMEGAS